MNSIIFKIFDDFVEELKKRYDVEQENVWSPGDSQWEESREPRQGEARGLIEGLIEGLTEVSTEE